MRKYLTKENIITFLVSFVLSALITFLLTSTTYGQARINYSKTEIELEWIDLGKHDQSIEDRWISYNFPLAEVMYLFNKENVCHTTLILPKNGDGLQFFINKYNKDLTLVSEFRWVLIENGINMYVELLFLEDGTYYFRWYE